MACIETNPVVVFDDSCPTIKLGSLDKMFLTRAKVIDELDDPLDLTDMGTRIDNAAADGNPVSGAAPIREFSIIGSTGERDATEIAIPLGDTYSVKGNKTFTFRILDLTTANLAWAVAVSAAGSVKKKAWFQGSDLFIGGPTGMNGFVKADIVFAEDRTTPVSINGTFITRDSLISVTTTLLTVYP